MKVEKFKVLLYLKKSEPDKTGKAPIMGRITLNRTMAQFSCKLSCTPGLWNARESRLNGKSREAVETNEKIERLLLAVHSAFNSLMERKKDFDAAAVRDMFQGNAGMQMTLLKLLDRHNEEMKARVGVDRAPTTMSTYVYTRRTLAEFIKTEFKVSDLAFGQLNEQFIRDYQDFCLEKKKLAMETVRHYLSILKKDLPHRLQGGALGEIPFLPLQAAQAEGDNTESTQPGEFREATRSGDTGKTQVTCHHPGPLPLRLLHRHRLCRCGKHHPGEPLPG